jgi:hypothetical protein
MTFCFRCILQNKKQKPTGFDGGLPDFRKFNLPSSGDTTTQETSDQVIVSSEHGFSRAVTRLT